MKDAKDVIPWAVTDISLRPYDGFWSFNPSIHFDGSTWRCVLRCCDYAMPDGVTIRSKNARPTGQQTKNAMVVLDPSSWKPISIFKMHEHDDYPRVPTPHVGYEDMRIFWTSKGGLQGIAASLHLNRDRGAHAKDSPQHQPPEQVLLSFDDAYNIVAARPIRGDGWSGSPQKNWVPFDHCEEPRFLYSISAGSMFDDKGAVHGDAAVVRPCAAKIFAGGEAFVLRPGGDEASPPPPQELETHDDRHDREDRRERPKVPKVVDLRRFRGGGGDVQLVRGRRLALDALSSRPYARPSVGTPAARSGAMRTSTSSASTRVLGSSRGHMPKYDGLRGGTQLVRIGDDAWLGLGHEMKFVGGKKYYWHTWYVVDARGKMTAVSEPMKLARNGIEFAAGMGIDGDRVVVSFGVDDMDCKVGETRLSAVTKVLKPCR